METFYRSLLPPQAKICGYSLKPFSYGHLAILRALESPFIDPDGEASSADLITALKVCTMSFPFGSFSISKRDRFKAWRLGLKPQKLSLQCVAFSYYMQENQRVPQFWTVEEGSWNSSSAPDELSCIANLIKNGIQHEEAWNMNIGYANWLSATFLEHAGNNRIFRDPIEDAKEKPLEDLNQRTDEELYQIALKDLGEERAKAWIEARRKQRHG